jgi:hypothetical protein
MHMPCVPVRLPRACADCSTCVYMKCVAVSLGAETWGSTAVGQASNTKPCKHVLQHSNSVKVYPQTRASALELREGIHKHVLQHSNSVKGSTNTCLRTRTPWRYPQTRASALELREGIHKHVPRHSNSVKGSTNNKHPALAHACGVPWLVTRRDVETTETPGVPGQCVYCTCEPPRAPV